MQLSIKKTVGKTTHTFLIEGVNLYELVMNSQKLSFPDITHCGLCGKDDLFLNARLTKEKYKYVEIKCKSCNGQLTFGQKKDDLDVFYIRKNDKKEYDWKKYENNTSE